MDISGIGAERAGTNGKEEGLKGENEVQERQGEEFGAENSV